MTKRLSFKAVQQFASDKGLQLNISYQTYEVSKWVTDESGTRLVILARLKTLRDCQTFIEEHCGLA